MSSEKSIWYRLGFALERSRSHSAASRLAGLAERGKGIASPAADRATRTARTSRGTRGGRASRAPVEDVLASGATALVSRLLGMWRPARRPGPFRLIRAGAAGAAAALLVDVVRPMLGGSAHLAAPDGDAAERAIAGAGQGLLYGAVIEPRIPGSALTKGVLYGSTEYLVDPVGGLRHLLGPHVSVGRIPLLRHLLEDVRPHERPYLEHVTFAVALAVLYGSSAVSNGMRDDADE